MTDFEPKKGKAAVKALAQELNSQSQAFIGSLADKWPEGAAVLGVLQASFGARLAYKQERLNQFTEHIMTNPNAFTKEVIASTEFQDGLIVFMNTYFRLRTDSKVALAQRIFDDFGRSQEKPIYPLERYDDTLEKISESGIRFLGFIHNTVPRIKEAHTKSNMRQNGNVLSDKPLSEWVKIYTAGEPLSVFVERHIVKEAKSRMKDYSGSEPLVAEEAIKQELRRDFNKSVSELEGLGLMRTFRTGLGRWSAGDGVPAYNLTDYGVMFTSIIKPDSVGQLDT